MPGPDRDRERHAHALGGGAHPALVLRELQRLDKVVAEPRAVALEA
jgi:hypothetical protein